MAVSTAVRLLALGNDILGDDALAFEVARQVQGMEVVCSSASGLHLLDDVLGTDRLIVVDTVQTGNAPPGTIYSVGEQDFDVTYGITPHCTGLFETLALARQLGLAAPREVLIIAVEAADCLTVGGEMHPAVRAAIPGVLEAIAKTR